MFRNILVLCTANICRSPLAEGLLRLKLRDRPDVQVHSAGVAALIGSRAHPVVLELLDEAGLDLRAHHARQCDLELLRQSDLVLVMERAHLKWLSTAYPQFHGRSFLMGHWREKKEVPDPIGKSRAVFEAVRDQIQTDADDWLSKILKPGPAKL